MTHTLKVNVPSLSKNYAEGCSNGKEENPKDPHEKSVKPAEKKAPISASKERKSVFTCEDEGKLKKFVSEYEINMFMTAKEKAAKLVVRKFFHKRFC